MTGNYATKKSKEKKDMMINLGKRGKSYLITKIFVLVAVSFQWCNPGSSISTWSNRDGVACDDGNACTRADTCRSGQCTATPFKCNSVCQYCNGNSCSLKTGFGFLNSKCTCKIAGG